MTKKRKFQVSLWKIIAKKELRIKTYHFRKNRRVFFILIYSLFLFWAAYLGPVILDTILPETLEEFLVDYKSSIVPLIEYLFSTLFLMYIIYPLIILFRRTEIKRREIIIAAPIESGDIFLGEFIAKLPFYFLFILGVGPFALTLINQISPGLTIIHYLFFYIIFFIMSIFGSLLGMVLSNWVEFRLRVLEKRRNISYMLLLLISFIVITIYYLFHFIFEVTISSPKFKRAMIFYPSFWYSNTLLYFIDPVTVSSYIINLWVNIILATTVPLLLFYISYNKAYKFYEIIYQDHQNLYLEKNTKDYYRFIKRFIPKKYENLVPIQLKLFFRKKENIIKIFYVIGIITLLSIIIIFTLDNQNSYLDEFLSSLPIVVQINPDINLIILMIAWLGGLIGGIFIGMYNIIDTKELLDTYKKSLRGVKSLIYSNLYTIMFLLCLLDIFFSVFFWLSFQLELPIVLSFFIIFLTNSGIILSQEIGIQCIRPLFEEQKKSMFFNNYFVIFLQIISLQITLNIFIPLASPFIKPTNALVFIFSINTGISFIFSILILHLGIQKLNNIE